MQGRAMKEMQRIAIVSICSIGMQEYKKGRPESPLPPGPDTLPFIARSQTDSSIRGCRVVANHECPLRFEFTTSRAHIE
jgi:hypothetical protein